MTTPPRKKKLLVFWSPTDFIEGYQACFANHPDYEVELVSTMGLPHEKAGYRRLLRLRKQVDDGQFDLVLSNNIMRSPFPGNKGWATTVSLAARYFTYQRWRLDTWWAPWMVRYGKSKTPLAVIDARDSHYVFPWDLPLLKAARFFFKRDLMNWTMRALQPLQNYYTEKRIKPYLEKLRPMSLGLEESRFAPTSRPMKDRDIDIFMSGGDNPLRRLVREKCEKLSGRYRVHLHKGLLPLEEYREMLQRAKLAVCIESLGGETWRQYEVAAAGAIPLMSWPYTQVVEPLVPDEHAFYFSYIADHFERTVGEALRDSDRLQRMSDAARQFVLEKKGRRKLLNYVVETTLAESTPA
jgi:glycosyltransferase involved in cell wall biosynthesis